MKKKEIVAPVIAFAIILAVGSVAILFYERGAQIQRDQEFVRATSTGNTNLVKALLDRGENVNATGFDKTSGLWSAVCNRQLSTVRLLLSHAANTEIPSQFGQIPLECAVDNLNNDAGTPYAKIDVAIIKLLISNGANVTKVKRNKFLVSLLNSYGIKI